MRRFLFPFLFCALLCQSSGLFAADIEPFIGKIEGGYNFFVSKPSAYSDSVPQPLIVFLHGASLCGSNLQRVRRYGVIHALDRGLEVPALVVAPQNPGGAWRPTKVLDVINWVESHYSVDTARVYVIGMSLGSFGTLDFVNAYPEKVAAAMALCGGCSDKTPDGLAEVPLWIMHGTADRAVSISRSKDIVNYLSSRHADSLLRYQWIPGADHGYPARLFYLHKTYDWLLRHSLSDSVRTVDRTITITPQEMNHAYR